MSAKALHVHLRRLVNRVSLFANTCLMSLRVLDAFQTLHAHSDVKTIFSAAIDAWCVEPACLRLQDRPLRACARRGVCARSCACVCTRIHAVEI